MSAYFEETYQDEPIESSFEEELSFQLEALEAEAFNTDCSETVNHVIEYLNSEEFGDNEEAFNSFRLMLMNQPMGDSFLEAALLWKAEKNALVYCPKPK